jgi:hypothetical protein
MSENRHPSISMHKLPVGAGFIGLVFTIGCGLIFLLGLPQLWYFVAFSAAFGVALAVVFHLIGNNRTERMKPISILNAGESASGETGMPVTETDQPSNLIKALPVPVRA